MTEEERKSQEKKKSTIHVQGVNYYLLTSIHTEKQAKRKPRIVVTPRDRTRKIGVERLLNFCTASVARLSFLVPPLKEKQQIVA